MGDLAVDTAVEGEGGKYRAQLSRDWEIWGPNGGYLAAIALRAAGAYTPLRRPATFACHYLGVADFEHVDLVVEPMRESKRAASLRVSMRQHDKPILEAIVWVVGELDGLQHDAARMPGVARPAELRPLRELLEADEMVYHRFWSNFDERPVHWIPRSEWVGREPGEPRVQSWYRYVPTATFADPFVDAARVLLLIDTLMWPAAVRAYRTDELEAFYAPSIDLSAQFHSLAPESEWLFCEAFSPTACDGLVGGTTSVWSEDGRLLGSGAQQMMCRPGNLQPGA